MTYGREENTVAGRSQSGRHRVPPAPKFLGPARRRNGAGLSGAEPIKAKMLQNPFCYTQLSSANPLLFLAPDCSESM